MENNDDLIDAVLCVLAGCDFLRGKCVTPKNDEEKIAYRDCTEKILSAIKIFGSCRIIIRKYQGV